MNNKLIKSALTSCVFSFIVGSAQAQGFQLDEDTVSWIQRDSKAEESKAISWRRDIHEHPELGNAEIRTNKIIANHLHSVGIEVETGVAKTGVIYILKGSRPGPIVALHADMDALPLKENSSLPFAIKLREIIMELKLMLCMLVDMMYMFLC